MIPTTPTTVEKRERGLSVGSYATTQTMMRIACEECDAEEVARLLAEGTIVGRDENGWTPLHIVADNDNNDINDVAQIAR
jgi:hypothetical protein